VANSLGACGGLNSDYPAHFEEPPKEAELARKTVLVCDNCSKEVDEMRGATLRITYTDARRGSKIADLCDDCAGTLPGRAAARRGRRPKATPATPAA
jgi:hypothetical protein